MKLCSSLFLLTASVQFFNSNVDAQLECTHGHLYISDMNSTNIYGYDLDYSLKDLTSTKTINTGLMEQNFEDTARGDVFAAVYRGNIGMKYTDGKVVFINSGTMLDDHGDHFHIVQGYPNIYENDIISCSRPIHWVRHDGKIGVFCDGFFPNPYNVADQVNSTIWIVDEVRFNMGAVLHSKTIEGSHHGVAIPIDEDHLLYSIALPGRINGTFGVTSLPSGFRVTDDTEQILHEINDMTDKNKHCSGFHGSSAYQYTFGLACDATHGGLLMVDYMKDTKTYTSRSLSYAPGFTTHRTGTLEDSQKTSRTAGNFASMGNMSHLLLFDSKTKEQTLTAQNMLALNFINGSQCAFSFDKAEAELMMVWLPNGKLRTYDVSSMTFNLVSELTIIPGMTACANATMHAGYGQAAIVASRMKEVYIVDLSDFMVHKTTLSYTPFAAIISGVPKGGACGVNPPPPVCGKRDSACRNDGPKCCKKLECRRPRGSRKTRCLPTRK